MLSPSLESFSKWNDKLECNKSIFNYMEAID